MAYVDDQMTQDSNVRYIRKAMTAPMLEREHEFDLARRWRDKRDEAALHELVTSYARLVVSIASKFRTYGLPMGDLIQEGNVGMMLAADKFDPDRDIRFSTYAQWWIKAQIQDYILRNWSIVRAGTTAAHKSLFFNLRRLKAQIESHSPDAGLTDDQIEEIAAGSKARPRDVKLMEARLSGGDHSLNNVINQDNDGQDEYIDFLADDRPNPEEVVVGMRDAQTRSQWLSEALGSLSDREQRIIKRRRLSDEKVVTLEDLGKELGVSKERVRQLEHRAMEKIKSSILKQLGDAGATQEALFLEG